MCFFAGPRAVWNASVDAFGGAYDRTDNRGSRDQDDRNGKSLPDLEERSIAERRGQVDCRCWPLDLPRDERDQIRLLLDPPRSDGTCPTARHPDAAKDDEGGYGQCQQSQGSAAFSSRPRIRSSSA